MLTLCPRAMPTKREGSMDRPGQGGGRDQSKLALTLLAPQHERHRMSDDLRALPRDTPDYHSRQAAHLRALAESTTTARLKARLLKDAEQHEGLAALADEEAIGAPVG